MNDLMNGLFELFGGFFIFNHCLKLYRDKQVKGVSLVSVIFFTLWGWWNLYYYPTIEQWWSFVGGLSIVLGNCLWVFLMIYYIRKNKVL